LACPRELGATDVVVVKRIRAVVPGSSPGKIPDGKVEANTSEWRERVIKELDKRPRGEQARIVEFVQRKYPRFSTGTMSGLLANDEKPGQVRYSRFIPLINQYLWPEEFAPVDEGLVKVLRTMSIDEQRALAEFLSSRKPGSGKSG
jgi:hypothetical protein